MSSCLRVTGHVPKFMQTLSLQKAVSNRLGLGITVDYDSKYGSKWGCKYTDNSTVSEMGGLFFFLFGGNKGNTHSTVYSKKLISSLKLGNSLWVRWLPCTKHFFSNWKAIPDSISVAVIGHRPTHKSYNSYRGKIAGAHHQLGWHQIASHGKYTEEIKSWQVYWRDNVTFSAA